MVASFRSPSLFLSPLSSPRLSPLLSSSFRSSSRVLCCERRGYSLSLILFSTERRLYTYFVFSSLSKTSFPCTCLFYPQSHSPASLSLSLRVLLRICRAFFFVFFLPLAVPATSSPGSSCPSWFNSFLLSRRERLNSLRPLFAPSPPDRHALPSLSSVPAHPRPASCPDNQSATVSI